MRNTGQGRSGAQLEDKLADAVLSGEIRPGSRVQVCARNKEIRFIPETDGEISGE